MATSLNVYFSMAYDYFSAAAQAETDVEKRKLVLSVADEYANTDDFISFPVENRDHIMLSNLSAFVANQVFMDNLIMFESQAEALNKSGRLNVEKFEQAKKEFNTTDILERFYEKVSSLKTTSLPDNEDELCKTVFINKLSEQNRVRLNDAIMHRNIEYSNKQFLSQLSL